MRVGGLRLLGPGARVSDYDRLYRPEPVPAASPFDPVMDLTSLQQAALMQMHESHVSRTITKTLLEDSQDKPGAGAYATLREHGLARYRHGKRLHELTAAGIVAAKDLERKLCQRFDIHLLIGPKGLGETVTFSCPCGWSQAFRNSHSAAGNARLSWNRHVATTVEGMSKLVVALKPPIRAEG